MLVKFEQNRMVQTTQNFELFDKKKKKMVFKNHFWQSFGAIFEDISAAETIFNAKLLIFRLPSFSVPTWKYGSLTHVTRLKVAPKHDGFD